MEENKFPQSKTPNFEKKKPSKKSKSDKRICIYCSKPIKKIAKWKETSITELSISTPVDIETVKFIKNNI